MYRCKDLHVTAPIVKGSKRRKGEYRLQVHGAIGSDSESNAPQHVSSIVDAKKRVMRSRFVEERSLFVREKRVGSPDRLHHVDSFNIAVLTKFCQLF